jgi:hypothetical protein
MTAYTGFIRNGLGFLNASFVSQVSSRCGV